MNPELLPQGLLSQGLDLMLFGMGTVFSFLIFLVFVTSLMSNVIRRFEPVRTIYTKLAEQHQLEEDIVEAIALAIEQHRKQGRDN